MDFLIIIAMSILTPFYLSLSEQDFNTSVGVGITNNSPFSYFARYSGSPVLTGTKSDYKINTVAYSGDTKFNFDTRLKYTINTDLFDNKLNFGFTSAWAPMQERINLTVQGAGSSRPSTSQIYFSEMPSYGVFAEYDLVQPSYTRFIKSSVSPYIGLDFMKVGYAGSEDYENEVLYDSVIKFTYGVNFKNNAGWNMFIENSIYNVEILYIETLKQNFILTVSKIKAGFSYTFIDQINKTRVNRDSNYEEILDTINPKIKTIKEYEEKAVEEEARLKKEALIEEQKKAEQLKIDQENKEKKAKSPKSNTGNKANNPQVADEDIPTQEDTFQDWQF